MTLDSSDAALIERVENSLRHHALAQIKRAASDEVRLHTLAFVGMAAWIDVVVMLFTGGKSRGQQGWANFIGRYLPARPANLYARHLWDGLRNALLHEYGTRNVGLVNNRPDDHWTLVEGNIRILDIHALIAEFEGAFDRYLSELGTDPQLIANARKRGEGLLAPVSLVPGMPGVFLDWSGVIAASASATVSDPNLAGKFEND